MNFLIVVFGLVGVLGMILPVFFFRKIRDFESSATPVRIEVVDIELIIVERGEAGTLRPKFRVVSGEHRGLQAASRFGTMLTSHAVGDEIAGFLSTDLNVIESNMTLRAYKKLLWQSVFVSPVFLAAAAYLFQQ